MRIRKSCRGHIAEATVIRKQEKIEKKPLKYTSVESEEIVNGQILVKVLANGVCHSDLHIVEGDFPLPASLFPLIPGHEIVGEVVESKSGIEKGTWRIFLGLRKY